MESKKEEFKVLFSHSIYLEVLVLIQIITGRNSSQKRYLKDNLKSK